MRGGQTTRCSTGGKVNVAPEETEPEGLILSQNKFVFFLIRWLAHLRVASHDSLKVVQLFQFFLFGNSSLAQPQNGNGSNAAPRGVSQSVPRLRSNRQQGVKFYPTLVSRLCWITEIGKKTKQCYGLLWNTGRVTCHFCSWLDPVCGFPSPQSCALIGCSWLPIDRWWSLRDKFKQTNRFVCKVLKLVDI